MARRQVGDVIKVHRGQFFPADLVFLCSSGNDSSGDCEHEKEMKNDGQDERDNSNKGVTGSKNGTEACFVDTKNLDGETNAKLKTAVLPGFASAQGVNEDKMGDAIAEIASCQSLGYEKDGILNVRLLIY